MFCVLFVTLQLILLDVPTLRGESKIGFKRFSRVLFLERKLRKQYGWALYNIVVILEECLYRKYFSLLFSTLPCYFLYFYVTCAMEYSLREKSFEKEEESDMSKSHLHPNTSFFFPPTSFTRDFFFLSASARSFLPPLSPHIHIWKERKKTSKCSSWRVRFRFFRLSPEPDDRPCKSRFFVSPIRKCTLKPPQLKQRRLSLRKKT